ncbi:DNA sulfur modification protein DndB [Paenibacillus tyrfis]|uniref:DNA sulfur modification protein DndB n=1 Tax=Paenibacillus tyrfis TaxID=1501230 RepID=UPI000B5961CD|nr:DNA sulfur modification protein DndB [Paenibacillus tyrfis]
MDFSILGNRKNQIALNATTGTQFGQQIVTAQCCVNDVLKFLMIDREVQRDIAPERVSLISKYIQSGLEGEDIFFSPLIFSARGQGEYDEDSSQYRLNMNDKLVILDGQHRIKAFENLKSRLEAMIQQKPNDSKLIELLEMLENFPLTVQIYLNLDIAKERQLFTDVNTKSAVVNNTLLIMYKKGDLYGELVKEIVNNHPTISPDRFECRSKTTRSKLATAATVYVVASTLNEGVYGRKPTMKINEKNYSTFKKDTEEFFTLLLKYTPKESMDRDKYVVFTSNVMVAIAKYVHEMKKKYPTVKMEDLFRKVIYTIDWSHKNNDFRRLAAKYNNQTKKYNFGSIGRIVRTFSEYLIDKYESVAKKHA